MVELLSHKLRIFLLCQEIYYQCLVQKHQHKVKLILIIPITTESFFPHVESVIGTDERKKVTSFTSSPIKENVAIKVEWKNSEGNYEGYVASGVMVSKDTVLTAAHVVYDEGRKRLQKE